MDSEAVKLPIIGFNNVIHHNYDAEVGGPLRGPFKDTFKKRRFYISKTSSPEKLQTVSVLSQSSRLFSWQNKTSQSRATSSYSHHVALERVEEFTPFCAAASSSGALPTPSCLSEYHFYHLVTWRRRHEHCRHSTQYEPRHTGMDYVVSRVRRSRLGAACFFTELSTSRSLAQDEKMSQRSPSTLPRFGVGEEISLC